MADGVVKLTVEVPADLVRRLRVVAVLSGRSQKEIVVGLVEAYVVKKEGERGGV